MKEPTTISVREFGQLAEGFVVAEVRKWRGPLTGGQIYQATSGRFVKRASSRSNTGVYMTREEARIWFAKNRLAPPLGLTNRFAVAQRVEMLAKRVPRLTRSEAAAYLGLTIAEVNSVLPFTALDFTHSEFIRIAPSPSTESEGVSPAAAGATEVLV